MQLPPFTNSSNEKSIITEIQNMLYYISFFDKAIPRINPDGIYGPKTTEAVRAFQTEYSLPVTGEVDFQTWSRLVEIYNSLSDKNSPALSLPVFPNPQYTIDKGEKSDVVLITQIVLNSLSNYLPIVAIDYSGEMDDITTSAVTDYQKIRQLPETGLVDKSTWNALARDYGRYELKNE